MYSIGRSATPIRVQQFWDAIDQCSTQSPVSFEQIITIVTSVHKVSRDEVNRELEAAVRDKLVIADVVQNEKQELTTLYKLPEQEMIKPDHHDWYCFYCHLGAGPVVGCKNCPRIFHLDCLLDDQKPDGDLFICPPCHIMATKTSAELLNLEPKQLNKILEYSCRRFKDLGIPQLNIADGGTWAIASSREPKDKWRYDLLVYFNIDLSQMLEKAVDSKYKSLEEFKVDCETLIHGISVYFGVKQPKLQDIAALFRKKVTHEILEIKSCHECVLGYYEKEKVDPLWICRPCKTPHEAVWAKLSGYPYWPAKVMRNDGSKYDVIFFGGNHEWGVIDAKNIQPIETPLSSLKIRETAAWNKAYEELEKFLEMAKNPEKIHSSPVKKLIIPAKSKDATGKRAASSSVEQIGTKKSKNEMTAQKSQEDIERAEPKLNMNSHGYEPRNRDPSSLDDNNGDVNPNKIPERTQQPKVFVNTELMKVKMEVDYVPIVAVKTEPDQEIEDDNNDNENEQMNPPEQFQQPQENVVDKHHSIIDRLIESITGENEKERVANLEKRMHFLLRKKTEITLSLQKKAAELILINEQQQTTINEFISRSHQQWTELKVRKELVYKVVEKHLQNELNNKLKSVAQNQQSIENSNPQIQIGELPTKILRNVISKLNLPNLRTARLVNKMWKKEADAEIRRRDCFRLKFDPESRPFNEGLKELEFSKELPCFDFHLSLSETNGLEEIENFVSLFGCQVKSLTLNSEINGKSLSTLLVGLPNLENLFVNDKFALSDYLGNEDVTKLTLPKDCLSNLKHLTYLTDVEYLGKILTFVISAGTSLFEIIDNAPNLQSIHNAAFHPKFLQGASLKWKGKVQLVKSFAFLDDEEDVYTNSGIKVENLFLPIESLKQQERVQKIIKSSQDTLTTLVTGSKFICLPQETGYGPLFLPFQNLKVLQIWIEDLMWNELCRNDFASKHLTQFKQEAFPNLTTVILEVTNEYNATEPTAEEQYSPFANAIQSVVNLEFRGRRDGLCGRASWKVDNQRMLRLKELFPNVKQLKLNDSPQIPQMLPFYFAHWPELESLQIHINFKRVRDMEKSVENPYFEAMQVYDNLDPVFTGLPLGICQKLKTVNKLTEHDILVAPDINSNSLLFLIELKKLTIVFSDIRPEIFRAKCPISYLSCIFPFKLKPNLKVRVLYDQNLAVFDPETRKFTDEYKMEEYLKELAPYCEFGHWENNGLASSIPTKFSGAKSCAPFGYL